MRTLLANRLLLRCLLAAHVIILLAGFVAPYDPAEQFRQDSFTPPSSIRFVDAAGRFHLRPFLQSAGAPSALAPIHFFQSGAPYRLLGLLPTTVHLFGTEPPARIFLFGADVYGRDQFSRFLYGGQLSVAVGLLATSLTLSIGALAGLFAGYYGGWRDSLVMRAAELFLALPWLYLLLGVRAILPLSAGPRGVLFLLAFLIGVLGWARPARLVRGVVMSAKTLPYVSAAQQFGASTWYVMRRHLLPETYAILLAQAALLVPQYIAAEVTLSFLGLGVPEPVASWGSMLSAMREISVLASYWWIAIPALALLPFFFCYQLFAQSMQAATGKES